MELIKNRWDDDSFWPNLEHGCVELTRAAASWAGQPGHLLMVNLGHLLPVQSSALHHNLITSYKLNI